MTRNGGNSTKASSDCGNNYRNRNREGNEMSEHDNEYRELLARVTQRDRDSITAHWELGDLFARYGESVTDIAMAISRSVTYVADHVRIVQIIPTREDLDRVLEDRDDIQTWTVLVDWVKAGGPGQESDEEPDAGDISRQKRQGRQQGNGPQGGGGQGGGSPSGGSQGGMQLTVPVHIVKGLADLGANPREVMHMFWQNVSPMLLLNVAYPDRVANPGPLNVPFNPGGGSQLISA